MYEKIKEICIKYKEIIVYLIFGVLATIVNLGVKYTLLFTILDAKNSVELQVSIIISWIAAVLFAYFTNRTFVFKSENKNKIKELISFVVGRIATLIMEMIVMWFFVTLLGLSSDLFVVIITVFAQALVIIVNYIFSKLFIFKKDKKTKY